MLAAFRTWWDVTLRTLVPHWLLAEATLSSLPHGSLQHDTLLSKKKKKQQTKKTRERENASKTQATVLYYLVLEVTSITFAVFMFIRSETLSPPFFKGKGSHKGMTSRKKEILAAILED